MRLLRSIFLFCVLVVLTNHLSAQDKSNRGKEFWLGYGYNWIFDAEAPFNTQELVLYLSADAPATVTVSVTNTSWSQTVTIPANTVNTAVKIPKTGADDARIFNEGLHNRAVHIVSDTPIVVYAHTFNNMVSAATMLMPIETFGYKYYSLNYSQATSGTSTPHPPATTTQNGPAWYSWFYVVATEDNTRLEITPSDTTRNGWLPGQTYTVNLNKGEIYNVMGKLVSGGNQAWQASKDMTGSKVLSVAGADGNCHPVALFSGSSGIRLCKNDGGEVMLQQVFPTHAWGTRYLTYHTLNNTNTDINATFKNFYRIAVMDPTTVVKRNGVVMTGLINNFYYEIVDSIGGDYIEANHPVLVAQYTPNYNECWRTPPSIGGTYGDPEMFYLSPLEQGMKDVLFYANRSAFIDYNYLNLVVSTAGLGSLRLDGNPVDPANTKPHPNLPGYSVAVARIPGASAQHRLTCDSIFSGTMYGLGYYESYGYNFGTFINNLNSYSEIKNTFNTSGQIDTVTCPKTPVRLFVKLAYPATSIHWKFSQVPGISPNADSIVSSPVPIRTELINGRTYYVYTLQQDFTFAQPGLYKIPISYSATVIENCNQTENTEMFVKVKPGPIADFSFINQCFRDTVRFTGTPTPNGFTLNNYLWTFHDATTQNTINAKKLYPAAGNYDVRYQVMATNGCFGDTTKTITVSAGTTPILTVSHQGKPCIDSTIRFTSSIAPIPGNPAIWYWDFGDGQTSTSTTSNTITHSYNSTATNIRVKHLVTLTNGCNPDTVYYDIPNIYNNPVAAFTMVADTPCPRKPVSFQSTNTGVAGWNWNIGGTATNLVPPFTRSFANSGIQTTTLIITDINGCGSAPVSQSVTINPAPAINAGPDKAIKLGTSTTLDATISNPSNYNYNWSPALYLSSTTVLNPVASPDVMITYTIEAVDKITFCSSTDFVVINPISDLFIPTAFTPNNDGKNDLWNIPGLALYPDATVTVFNRWGERIYMAKNYTSQPWNGKYKGILQPHDSYIFVIQIPGTKPQLLKGTVTLIY